ncbi:MAG: hypothetical protein WC043_01585 [Pseudobdellovibrionaceae bacterium]
MPAKLHLVSFLGETFNLKEILPDNERLEHLMIGRVADAFVAVTPHGPFHEHHVALDKIYGDDFPSYADFVIKTPTAKPWIGEALTQALTQDHHIALTDIFVTEAGLIAPRDPHRKQSNIYVLGGDNNLHSPVLQHLRLLG